LREKKKAPSYIAVAVELRNPNEQKKRIKKGGGERPGIRKETLQKTEVRSEECPFTSVRR